MFAYGVPAGRVLRGGMLEAFIVGILGTTVGIPAGRLLLAWLVNVHMPETLAC
jgi:hypothetical protein